MYDILTNDRKCFDAFKINIFIFGTFNPIEQFIFRKFINKVARMLTF